MILSLVALFLAVAAPVQSSDPDVVVTSLADSGPGSLRQAIADAPANGTIRFAVEGDIVLTSGQLLIDKPLRILGRGEGRITVRVPDNVNTRRVLEVTAGPVKISDLTIKDGNDSILGDSSGGGIENHAELQLLRVTLRDNISVFGGGLSNESGAKATLINCTVSGNYANDPGICDGGEGGGIGNFGGTVILINTTITNNIAECLGGGLYMNAQEGDITMSNTIVANNTEFLAHDCYTRGGEFVSRGFNLDSDGTCGLDQPGDLPGMDPLLGPLQDNGGFTDTHLPMAGSPVIDSANTAAAPRRDQRGVIRPQGAAADIGSVEVKQSD